VVLVDASGSMLSSVKAHDGFQVVARLQQGREGAEDVDHSDVTIQGDLIMANFLQTGGIHANDTLVSKTPSGIANWSGTQGFQIRRQAGNFFKIHFTIMGDSRARSFLETSTASFGIIPGIVKISPWSFGVAGERPSAAFPALPIEGQLVELPKIVVEFQDGSGLPLSHSNCNGCVSITNEAMREKTCDVFAIRSPDIACADPPYTEIPAAHCRWLEHLQNLVPMGERTREECQEDCEGDPECIAFNFLDPTHPNFDSGLTIASICNLVKVRCEQEKSENGGSIFYKPDPTDLSEGCRCPSEVFDGRVVHHTLYSIQVVPGTRHVAAR